MGGGDVRRVIREIEMYVNSFYYTLLVLFFSSLDMVHRTELCDRQIQTKGLCISIYWTEFSICNT